ncbi:MAG TPA: succinate dehydrogenase/fumarate reductase iron-sulfur subunit [Baekduia sp.]|nr:succinate dehydrogenase/fumarate reductase iron-sulfur subunit [Baekduia sp.]
MPRYALRLRRFTPETRPDAWWQDVEVELDAHRSVLDAILEARERDGTLAIRFSCRAAICGSCGVRVNGRSGLACHTQLGEAAATASGGVIVVEPLGNMPVLKDLIVDMDPVHWAKVASVQPWLVGADPGRELEYEVAHETMVDVTQAMACIQCGACVSDCLSLEVDPAFVGPAALAKAYRFAADPRDADHEGRLRRLAEDPHGLYDCTHCFACIEACPKGVAPMNQIMRLRRMATTDHAIDDGNNGRRHEHGFVANVRRNGLLHEAELLTDSYGGRLHPRTVPVLLESLTAVSRALRRRKVGLRDALGHPHRGRFPEIARYVDEIEGRPERVELNLYVSGYDDEDPGAVASAPSGEDGANAATGPNPRRRRP